MTANAQPQRSVAGGTPPPPDDQVAALARAVADQVAQVVRGRRRTADLAVTALLAEGHLLIEDVPGVGKTTLAKALAASLDASVGRIQFTPDLMPSDITGSHVYLAERGGLEFRAGPVFAHIVIADEINRASPKTQSALLEAMQEGHVTVDGTTYALPRPFLVVATQNPVELEGTYPLPEAQRDRFLAQTGVGYPDLEQEIAVLDGQEIRDPLTGLRPVATADQVQSMIASVRRLYTAPAIKRYIAELARATRLADETVLGASPRAAIQLLRAAKAAACLAQRRHVLPDDVQGLVLPVWGHRLVLTRSALRQGVTPESLLRRCLERTPVR
ncbi:MAG: AAA family ATPase [Propionibacteriaceae bacterium]|jgi:MoxR-like ATPase|nr:AAA family ATPase [Propionibacteriaceae bacterium]